MKKSISVTILSIATLTVVFLPPALAATETSPPSAAQISTPSKQPAAAAVKTASQSAFGRKFTEEKARYYVKLAQTGRGGLFLGSQLALLSVTDHELYQAVMPRDPKAPKQKTKPIQMTAERRASVLSMTKETASAIQARQQTMTQTLSARSAGYEAYAAVEPVTAADVGAMAGCFGLSGAMFALPHPYSYVGAGAIFAGCMAIFSNKLIPWIRLP